MCVGISTVVYNPEQVADDGGCDERGVYIPAHKEAGEGLIELFEDCSHDWTWRYNDQVRARS